MMKRSVEVTSTSIFLYRWLNDFRVLTYRNKDCWKTATFSLVDKVLGFGNIPLKEDSVHNLKFFPLER